MNFCYVYPDSDDLVVDIKANENNSVWRKWMYITIDLNPDVIFFFTVDTTDIWDDEVVEDEPVFSMTKEQAMEVFFDQLQKPCPRAGCDADINFLCDTPGVWIHLQRFQATTHSRI